MLTKPNQGGWFILTSQRVLFFMVIAGIVATATADIDDKTAMPTVDPGINRRPIPNRFLPPILPLAASDITDRISDRLPSKPQASEINVKIVDLAKMSILESRRIPQVFFWPNKEMFHDAVKQGTVLQTVEEEWNTDFVKWESLFVSFREPRPAKFKFYKANEWVYYYLPSEENTIVRFISDPPKSRPRGLQQIQFLIQATHSNENIRELLGMLPKWSGDGRIAESNLTLLTNALKIIPMSQNLKDAHWHLESFGYDSTYNVAKIKMITKDVKSRSLSLQVVIGPCGDLFVLSGPGLEPDLKDSLPKNDMPGNMPNNMPGNIGSGLDRGLGVGLKPIVFPE
jgi:hypothetical protein